MINLKPIALCDELCFPDLEQVQLYKDFCVSKEETEKGRRDHLESTSEKWMAILKKNRERQLDRNVPDCVICPQSARLKCICGTDCFTDAY